MTAADLDIYTTHFPEWKKKLPEVNTIFMLSSNTEQMNVFTQLFPSAKITRWATDTWNLNEENTES